MSFRSHTHALLRLSVLAVAALLAAASGGSGTATGRSMPPYQPPPPQQGQWNAVPGGPVPTVEGHGFGGTDGNDRINFYFRAGGVLHYRDPQGWWEDGRWTQAGSSVSITLSDGFATYTGFINGNVISGEARNKNGKAWKFSVTEGTQRRAATVDITNSKWGGKEDKSCIVFFFRDGGVLEYDTPSGHYVDGSWDVDGDWVYFKHKNTNFEYFGSIKGERMNGNLWSTEGKRWSWDVNKNVVPDQCAPGVAKGGAGKPPAGDAPGQNMGVATLEGTTWEGDNGGDPTTLQFKPGGILLAKDPQGDWKGSWFQNGSQVTFDLNGRYSWYEGVVSGSNMTGAGHNKDGLDWRFTVSKK